MRWDNTCALKTENVFINPVSCADPSCHPCVIGLHGIVHTYTHSPFYVGNGLKRGRVQGERFLGCLAFTHARRLVLTAPPRITASAPRLLVLCPLTQRKELATLPGSQTRLSVAVGMFNTARAGAGEQPGGRTCQPLFHKALSALAAQDLSKGQMAGDVAKCLRNGDTPICLGWPTFHTQSPRCHLLLRNVGYSALCVTEQLTWLDRRLLCFGAEARVPVADGNVLTPSAKVHGSTEVKGFEPPPVTAENAQGKQVRRTRGA